MNQPIRTPHEEPQPPAVRPPALGAPQGVLRRPRLKSPAVAASLSVLPGLGQAYLGFPRLGFTHALAIAILIALLAPSKLGVLEPFFVILLLYCYCYNLVSTYRRAVLMNDSLLAEGITDLPEGPLTLSFPQRMGIGLGFVLLGGLLLLDLRYGLPLDWLNEWWPVGPILYGISLVIRALRDRAASQASSPDD